MSVEDPLVGAEKGIVGTNTKGGGGCVWQGIEVNTDERME